MKSLKGEFTHVNVTSLNSFSFLHFNVALQATQDELKAAYRRLCMLYHPDKHRDPELKRQAEQLFNFVHEAYEGKNSFDLSTAFRNKLFWWLILSLVVHVVFF